MHLSTLLLTTLTTTFASPLQPNTNYPITLILTIPTGGPANYTFVVPANNQWSTTSNVLSISKIYSQSRSIDLLHDCDFKTKPTKVTAAKAKFVQTWNGSLDVGPPQPILAVRCRAPTCKATWATCGVGDDGVWKGCCPGSWCSASKCRAIG